MSKANQQDLTKPSPSLSTSSIVRLAQHLLQANRHLKEFEVELEDEHTCETVEEELRGKGCRVRRIPFKLRLEIKCPHETVSKRAA